MGSVIWIICVLASAQCALADNSIASVWNFELETQTQVDMVNDWATKQSTSEVDFWVPANAIQPTIVLVQPEQKASLKALLDSLEIEITVSISDVYKAVKDEFNENYQAKVRSMFRTTSTIVGTFANYDETTQWIKRIAKQNPTIASLIDIGTSHEGRKMTVLKLSGGKATQSVWIDSGIHAREWLAPASIVYVIDAFIRDYRSGSIIIEKLLGKFDWYFLPVANPDGYAYTFNGVRQRMWRKTRQQHQFCYGADPNRNFDANFGGVGTSNNPCTDIYRGPHAFSEPCSKNIADFHLARQGEFRLFLTTHAFGQLWLTTWGYTDMPPEDSRDQRHVAQIAVNAIYKSSRATWKFGTPKQTLGYAASGGSHDWAKKVAGIKYAYGIEVRPSHGQRSNGFLARLYDIPISGKEMYAAFKAVAMAI